MRSFYLALLIACGVTHATAQKVKLDNVAISDFQAVSPLEDNPDAIFLYKKLHVMFTPTGEQLRIVQNRILIKNEEGLRYATHKLRVYNESASKRERMKSIKGYTYNLVDGELKKDKLKSDAVFEEEINEVWSRKSFVLPNVQIGSIIEFEYTVASPFFEVDDIIIQEDVPVNQIDIAFEPLPNFTYSTMLNPRSSYLIDLSNSSSGKQFSGDTSSVSFVKKDVPALVKEPMAGDVDLYRAKMVLELAAVRYNSGDYKSFTLSWEDVCKTIYESDRFGKQLRQTKYFEDDLATITRTGFTEQDQLQDVMNFLRSKVIWNNRYGKYASDDLKSIYKAGSGNVADINLLLTAMLRSLGLDANPVLVSSKNNGMPLFPTLNGFDYVVVEARMPSGKKFLLDATEKFNAPNLLPVRALNWQGRVIKDSQSSNWTDLMPTSASKELTVMDVIINEDNSITAKSQKRRTDYLAYRMRGQLKNLDDDRYYEVITENEPGLEVSNLEFKAMDNPLAPLGYTYSFAYEDGVEQIGNKLYIAPLFHESTGENPFKLDERTLPVDLNYPLSSKSIINIKIPKGYVVESLPKSLKSTFNNTQGAYAYLIEQRDDMIHLNISFDISQYVIVPQDYKLFKEFFTAMIDKEAEKIVLKKA
ncbi:MAG: DUF3857 and transglutaminase domain-containing protein [Nonlabens sp.]|nr:DUF3857 and transglutaminase domain-containing protein [Nonlabens sp.]